MKTVSEEIGAVDAEDDNRWELRTVRQRLGVLANDLLVDLRADLRTAIGDETCQEPEPHAQGHGKENRGEHEEEPPALTVKQSPPNEPNGRNPVQGRTGGLGRAPIRRPNRSDSGVNP